MNRATILVIDDEQNFLDIIADSLKNFDYRVLQALNGKMGCIVAERFLPDIILCDWEMPIMNGIDTIRHLKSQDKTKDIPVIMATGSMTSAKNLDKALGVGAVDYIRKPLDPIELVARVNSTLKLANSYKEIKYQNNQITGSLNYAKTIQQAMLPRKEDIDKVFESFILYKPKDIVSGDFYWFATIPESNPQESIIAVVDCTGHGVPGAFMSMIGNRLLSEIIKEKRIYEPVVILNKLHEGIKKALKQETSHNDDGMDICLCAIKLDKNDKAKITFAGAKRPLIYYSYKEKSINLVKGDIKPVGGLLYEELEFTQQEISIDKGDIIYLTSDGFADQNNSERKKFGKNLLLDLLKSIALLPMNEQKDTLENVLSKHQEKERQRDDITIVGLTIN